jgi:uncharacterized protein YlzI (FlbEa/FlbD family)
MITLTALDGTAIYVNPELVAYVRHPLGNEFATKAKAVVNAGNIFAVQETPETVRAMVEGAMTPVGPKAPDMRPRAARR